MCGGGLDELRAPSTTESNSVKTLLQTQTVPQAQAPPPSASPTPKRKPHPQAQAPPPSPSPTLPAYLHLLFFLSQKDRFPISPCSLTPGPSPWPCPVPLVGDPSAGDTSPPSSTLCLHPARLLVLVQGETLPSPPPCREGLPPGHPSLPSSEPHGVSYDLLFLCADFTCPWGSPEVFQTLIHSLVHSLSNDPVLDPC